MTNIFKCIDLGVCMFPCSSSLIFYLIFLSFTFLSQTFTFPYNKIFSCHCLFSPFVFPCPLHLIMTTISSPAHLWQNTIPSVPSYPFPISFPRVIHALLSPSFPSFLSSASLYVALFSSYLSNSFVLSIFLTFIRLQFYYSIILNRHPAWHPQSRLYGFGHLTCHNQVL